MTSNSFSPTKHSKLEVLDRWRTAQAVCFDVDSTVVTEEGIDILADHCGSGEAVAAWTAKAMGGSVPFHEALEARLALMTPSHCDVVECVKNHPLQLTTGIEELVDTLHKRGVHVYLVSGGFRQMINPVAEVLEISHKCIFANNLVFKDDGSYAGFDTNEPTSRAGGKAKVVADLKAKHGYKCIFMVGDGATDMEARAQGGADAFIGYGGVVVRDVVKNGADLFIKDMHEIINPLKQ